MNEKIGKYWLLIFYFMLSAIITFSVYPFIGLTDGYTRWNMAMEILDNGKIVSDNLLSPVIPYIQAFTYKVTGDYGFYTFIQCFLFYYSIGRLNEILLGSKYISIFNREIKIWYLITIIVCLFPTVYVFPALLTDSAPIFIILVTLIGVQKSSVRQWIKMIISFGLIVLCVGVRANSVILFALMIFTYLIISIYKKEKGRIIILMCIGVTLSCCIGISINNSKYNAGTLGMVWDMIDIISEYDNQELEEELSKYGDVKEALNRDSEKYLNALVWDDNPPFSAYDISGKYANSITKLYLNTFVKYPGEFIVIKLKKAMNSLGIGSYLISSSRGIPFLDEHSSRDGAVNNQHQNEVRRCFINVTDCWALITLKPIVLMTCCFLLNVILSKFEVKHYWGTFGIAIGYYFSFLLNTQAYEFRYFAPSFYLLLICVVSQIVEVLYIITKFDIFKKHWKKILIILLIVISFALGVSIVQRNKQGVVASELTDENWTNGILNSNNTEILFSNTAYNYAKLKKAKIIVCDDDKYSIVDIYSDSYWIHVYVDRDATACGYPSVLTVE